MSDNINILCSNHCKDEFTIQEQTRLKNNLKAQVCETGIQIKEDMDMICEHFVKQNSSLMNEVLVEYASTKQNWVRSKF